MHLIFLTVRPSGNDSENESSGPDIDQTDETMLDKVIDGDIPEYRFIKIPGQYCSIIYIKDLLLRMRRKM
jgi:hypothetical protein